MDDWKWPPEFPEECPPTNAKAANGTYYRIAKFDPPNAQDFVSTYSRNRAYAASVVRKGRVTVCETMGLSVYTDIEDAIQCAGQIPQIGDMIVEIRGLPECGVVLPTPRGSDSHHTWWVARGFDPTNFSKVVRNIQEMD